MKIIQYLSILFLSLFLSNSSFSQAASKYSFIEFSIIGKDHNDTLKIQGDGENLKIMTPALVGPESTNSKRKVASIEYLDGDQEMSALLRIPGEKILFEIKEDNPTYKFSIFIDDKNLVAESMSFNVTEYKEDKIIKMTPYLTKGSFEGIMVYKYEEDGQKFRESYSVSGIFQYTNGRYKPKKSKK